MDKAAIITTFVGGLLFVFFLQIVWGRLVNRFGALGGFLAATLISGTMWILNHGLNKHLIHQSGSIWIDMSWAAAIGGITFSLIVGKSMKKSIPNIIAAVIGGIVSGLLINLILH